MPFVGARRRPKYGEQNSVSNFAFLKATLPELYRDAASAESYVTTDPRSACFYSRRTVELLANYLYEILNLPPAYRNDLAARINDSAFKAQIEPAIGQKLDRKSTRLNSSHVAISYA